MLKLSLSATLPTLFTSPAHAQSIEGDLLEEARSRGRIWFWSHLVRTTLALWRKGFSESPLALVGLTVACGAAWLLPLVVGEVDDSPGLFVFGTLLAGSSSFERYQPGGFTQRSQLRSWLVRLSQWSPS